MNNRYVDGLGTSVPTDGGYFEDAAKRLIEYGYRKPCPCRRRRSLALNKEIDGVRISEAITGLTQGGSLPVPQTYAES